MKKSIFIVTRNFSNNVNIQVGAFSLKEKAEQWLKENLCDFNDYKINEVVFYE